MQEINEEWRDAVGYEGLYMVSNIGRVKSLNYLHTKKEKILKPGKNTRGYLYVNLCKKGKIKNTRIHRLVCEAFLPNPLNLPQVNHINEIKEDNRVENLEWCSHIYNQNFGTRNERLAKAFSKSVKCLETGDIYPSTMYVERKLGFNHSDISACCNKKYGHKTVGGLHWEWAE